MNAPPMGIVVQYPNIRSYQPGGHESVWRRGIAKKLAALKGYELSDNYDCIRQKGRHVYFVPDDTLSIDQARAIGIVTEEDFFGGIVPHPFMANKTIAHPLIDAGNAPEGWSHDLARRLKPLVLAGYSAFSIADTRRAVARMLEDGPVRLKPGGGIGGQGQSRIGNAREFEAILNSLDEKTLSRHGMVIERHLEDVMTYSVGQARIADLCIAYCGTQELTRNNTGNMVYGGSRLWVIRGELEMLLEHSMTAEMRRGVNRACRFDALISEAFPELLASRRNYDVIQGTDNHGARHISVLEQSWRLGGASPAEVAAAEAFQADPALRHVRATCVEAYGIHVPPAEATVYFNGIDAKVGRITKYCYVEKDTITRR